MFLSLIHDGTTGPLPVGGSVQLSLGAARWDLGLAQLVAQVATTHVTARSRNVAAWGPQGCIWLQFCTELHMSYNHLHMSYN